jgi:hypothetical protein
MEKMKMKKWIERNKRKRKKKRKKKIKKNRKKIILKINGR